MTTKPKERPAPILISRKDAADMLGVSPRTVTNLANAGFLRSVKIGRSLRFDAAHLIIFSRIGTGGQCE